MSSACGHCGAVTVHLVNPEGRSIPVCTQHPNCPYARHFASRMPHTYAQVLAQMNARDGIRRQHVSGYHPTDAQPAVTRALPCMPWGRPERSPATEYRPLDYGPVPLINSGNQPSVIRWYASAGKNREFGGR